MTDFTRIHKKEWVAVFFMFALGNFIIVNFILRESITFTIMLIGIIISTIGDYVFEIVSRISYQELSSGFHTETLLDSIYILSYLMIAVGLYVHLNYYKWTMKKIDIDKLDLTFS